MVEEFAPKSNLLKDGFFAFIVGGAICTLGQFFINFYETIGLEILDARSLASITLVFLSALLTSLHLYNHIAKFAGAGTLVPITGFANAVVSPAIEFKSEGQILGVTAKMFVIAGPVIVFANISAVIYGIAYYLCQYVF